MLLSPQHKFIIYFFPFLTPSIYAQTTQICDSTNATTNSGRYTFFPDITTTDKSGYQCTDVSCPLQEEMRTVKTNLILFKFSLADENSGSVGSTTQFNTTFSWSSSPDIPAPPSFPSLTLNLPSILPIAISNISLFPLTNNWALYPGNPLHTISATTPDSLLNASVIAACYLNIYLDLEPSLSLDKRFSATKISIWQANYGGLIPLGYNDTTSTITRPVINLAGISYTLYVSQTSPSTSSSPSNSNSSTIVNDEPQVPQTIYTWFPSVNATTLTAMDISPLLNYLWREVYISSNTYVGFVEWGLDARNSIGNVTWSVYETGMTVKPGTPVRAVGMGRRKEVGRGEMLALVGLFVGAVVLFG
ncbi:putative glycosyltransferase family 2 protein [Botrytis fragariae]|uniref:Putative glycosyltransferase family 2 protein n=1 Tax=Botrytis fragariae TaxID=1964551 RepID=A0A8H6EE24_9HELO|nr:putative glycosyltransferase family 2 protein [Botrytis fragariae]KAF5868515.1 putative glycosyltransferase family 2 protein [Botrytis fragariae]